MCWPHCTSRANCAIIWASKTDPILAMPVWASPKSSSWRFSLTRSLDLVEEFLLSKGWHRAPFCLPTRTSWVHLHPSRRYHQTSSLPFFKIPEAGAGLDSQLYHSFSISRGKNLEFFLHCSTFSRDHLQMLRFRTRWEYCFSFSAQIFRFSITLSDIITNGLEIVELSRLGQQIYLDLAWWHIDIDTRYLSICRWHQMVGGLFYESVGNLDRRPFDAQTQLFNFQLRHFSACFWFCVSLTFHFSSQLQGGRMCLGRTELGGWSPSTES